MDIMKSGVLSAST